MPIATHSETYGPKIQCSSIRSWKFSSTSSTVSGIDVHASSALRGRTTSSSAAIQSPGEYAPAFASK